MTGIPSKKQTDSTTASSMEPPKCLTCNGYRVCVVSSRVPVVNKYVLCHMQRDWETEQMKLTPPPRSSLEMGFTVAMRGCVVWRGPGQIDETLRPSIIWYVYTQAGRKLVWTDSYGGFDDCPEELWRS